MACFKYFRSATAPWGFDGEHKKVFIAEEKYEGHNECYAESAADNYVFGIKSFEENKTDGKSSKNNI